MINKKVVGVVIGLAVGGVAPTPSEAATVCRQLYQDDYGVVARAVQSPSFVIVSRCDVDTLRTRAEVREMQARQSRPALAIRMSAPGVNVADREKKSTEVKKISPALPKSLPPPQPSMQIGEGIVYFDFDQYAIRKDQVGALKQVQGPVTVTGYACEIGDEQYNLDLSLKRAQEVAEFLKAQGVEVVNVKGLGECCPVSEDLSQNRRVSITPRSNEK
ncbi:OmpA family protein [Geoalkalibacter halelectricus]|uniref:OmpA family protein n=1 Tax=Geoalkalibacter halelectricus TaxID=2847045 RepID=UPI00266FA99D|nr:OmpA family protein [Geoalkalibacter halelectricus]MDO3380360.1 OmpA family protein [Geoalkalibacter halelectricus]